MTKILLTNDWHISAKNPVSRTDDYNGEIFELLDQLLQLAQHIGASGIAIAGDLFHDKHPAARLPWVTLHTLANWCIRCQQAGVELWAIPGNHDLLQDNYATLPKRPLGILFEAGLIQNVSGISAGPGVYGVPWPTSAEPEAFEHIPADARIVLAHAFATPDGGVNYGEHCHTYDALAVAAPHVQVWHFGHDHTDHGVYSLKNGAKVVNIGALSRGALDQDTLARTVKTAIVTLQESSVEVVQVALRVKPVDQVFDLKLHARKRQESAHIATFIQQLQTGLLGLSLDYRDALAGMALEKDVRSSVETYITKAEASVS